MKKLSWKSVATQLQFQLLANMFSSGSFAAPAQCTNALHLHKCMPCIYVCVTNNNQVNHSVGQLVKDIGYWTAPLWTIVDRHNNNNSNCYKHHLMTLCSLVLLHCSIYFECSSTIFLFFVWFSLNFVIGGKAIFCGDCNKCNYKLDSNENLWHLPKNWFLSPTVVRCWCWPTL